MFFKKKTDEEKAIAKKEYLGRISKRKPRKNQTRKTMGDIIQIKTKVRNHFSYTFVY